MAPAAARARQGQEQGEGQEGLHYCLYLLLMLIMLVSLVCVTIIIIIIIIKVDSFYQHGEDSREFLVIGKDKGEKDDKEFLGIGKGKGDPPDDDEGEEQSLWKKTNDELRKMLPGKKGISKFKKEKLVELIIASKSKSTDIVSD